MDASMALKELLSKDYSLIEGHLRLERGETVSKDDACGVLREATTGIICEIWSS